MAKAAYDLPADVSFRDAARHVLLAAFRMMQENTDATRAGLMEKEPTLEGVKALHDMRVGSRRLRAALSVFGSVFPPDDFRKFNRQLGDITDALGSVRDFDVQIASLQSLHDRLPENEAYGIARLIARQTKKRDKQRKVLLLQLDDWDKDRFERRFLKALSRALPESNSPSETDRKEAA